MGNAKKIKFTLFGETFEKTFDTKERASFFLKCVKIANASNEPKTVSEGFLKYVNTESIKKKESSAIVDKRCLRAFNRWLNSKDILFLNEIKAVHFEEYQSHLLLKLKPSSVNRYFNTIKHCFKKLHQWEYVEANRCIHLRALESHSKPVLLWTYKDFMSVKKRLKSSESKLILAILWHTGARISSVLELTSAQVIGDGTLILKTQKGPYRKSKFYKVPISKEIEGGLLKLADKQRLFTISRHAFSKQIHRATQKNLTIHGLRHTFATRLNENNIQLQNICRLLGHSNSKVTEKYIKTDIKTLRQCLKSLHKK